MIKYQNVWFRQEMLQEFRKGSDNSVALLFSAYKLANCSTICMKYFTLVFLAALGLDSEAALRAYRNICTLISVRLTFFFSLQAEEVPYTNQSAHERQLVFDSHISFNFKIRNQPCHSLFFNPVVLIPPLQTPRDIERWFNLNLMSMTNELAIKGQINLWLRRISDENPHGHDAGE